MSRLDILLEAREWIGTPWHHAASCKGVGTDCIGLIVGIARACGIAEAREYATASEYRGYGRDPNPALLIAGCERWLAPIATDDAAPADILIMRFTDEPQHFALVSALDPMYIIHAYAQARKVVENRVDDLWRSRIVRAYRFRGIEPWPV